MEQHPPRPLPPLRVRVIGVLDVEGVSAAKLGSRKARTLFTALVVAQRPVPQDVAADVVWGNAPPSSPADQLSVLASRLRRVLGSARVVKSAAGYEVRGDWSDVGALRPLVADAEARLATGQVVAAGVAAAAALALERGEVAAGETSPWFDDERRTVERVLLRAHSVATAAALAGGEYRAAAASARRLLDADPYDESAALSLMRALHATGRPSSALAVYAQLRRRLIDDLGVSPSAEIEELQRAILIGDRAPAPAPKGIGTAGRRREVDWLAAALETLPTFSAAGVAIDGEAGAGKSALLRAFTAVARDAGAIVLAGRCDPAGRGLPLQAVVDAVSAWMPVAGDDADHVAIPPAVARLLADEGAAPAVGPAGPSTANDRRALHRQLVELLATIGRRDAVVLIVDDVHWADAATIEWLELARRTGRHLLVVAARRPEGPADLVGFARLLLAPFGETGVAGLVGPEGAGVLDALDENVATVVMAASVLGPRVDLDLLASVLRRSAAGVLDDLDVAARAQIVVEHGGALVFQHELAREAIAASVLAPRRAQWHRDAAVALDRRSTSDPVLLAWHARNGGATELAVAALRRAAALAVSRFELDAAEALLDEAIELYDGADARLDRGRVRMAAGRLDDARTDAERALEWRYDAPSLELAGWIAYYRRDHDMARACADAGVAMATEPDVRASLLALGGRHRHTRGELAAAAAMLEEASATATGRAHGLAVVWLAGVRAHTGAPAAAAALAARGSLDAIRGDHPFALLHALFARAVALGQSGRIVDALSTLDQLDATVAREGSQARRFGPIAANVRAWLLRNLGRLGEADDLNAIGAATPVGSEHAEAHYVAHLDLAEGRMLAGDVAAAAGWLDRIVSVEDWQGSMAWRQQDRYRLLRARIDLDLGDAAAALHAAQHVHIEAAARGSARYALFAELVMQRAAVAADPDQVCDRGHMNSLLERVVEIAAPEAWWLHAQMAASRSDDRWWADAEQGSANLAASAGPAGDRLVAFAAEVFTRWR